MNVPKFMRQEPTLRAIEGGQSSSEQFAGIGQLVLAARERGDVALEQTKQPPSLVLPPTAANVYAGNALDILKKREEMLNTAVLLASDCELLAGELISLGARMQEAMAESQRITTAIVEARPALAVVLPSSEPQAEPVEAEVRSEGA